MRTTDRRAVRLWTVEARIKAKVLQHSPDRRTEVLHFLLSVVREVPSLEWKFVDLSPQGDEWSALLAGKTVRFEGLTLPQRDFLYWIFHGVPGMAVRRRRG